MGTFASLENAVDETQSQLAPYREAFAGIASMMAEAQSRMAPHREAFARLASMAAEVQSQLVPHREAFARIGSMVVEAQSRMAPYREAFAGIASMVAEAQSRMAPHREVFARLASMAAEVQSQLAPHREAIARVGSMVAEAQSRIAPYRKTFARIGSMVAEAQSQLASLRTIGLDELTQQLQALGESGAVIVEDDVAAVELVIHEPKFLDLPTAEQIKQLIAEIKKQDNPIRKQLLFGVVMILLTLVLTDIYDRVKLVLLPSKPTHAVREVRSVIEDKRIPSDLLREYRVVARERITVREKKKHKSNIVGYLNCGRIVHVLEKHGKWCLIVWQDNESNNHEGWVPSKYLKRLSRK